METINQYLARLEYRNISDRDGIGASEFTSSFTPEKPQFWCGTNLVITFFYDKRQPAARFKPALVKNPKTDELSLVLSS